jgi:hypothetical protein
MDLILLLEMDLDMLSHMGAIEVAALCSLCKATQRFVTDAPVHAFEFTFAPVLQRLSKFMQGEHLLWVVHRLGYDECLVQGTHTPTPHRIPCYGAQSNGDQLHPLFKPIMAQRQFAVERDIRAFWFHPHVQALRTAAIRLDCCGLMRRVAKEANKVFSDGEAYFLYNFWVFIEDAQLEESGPWEPLRADNTSAVGELFFSKLHFVLWTNMKIIRQGERWSFTGYKPHREYTMKCSCSSRDNS